jgi:hypothetical protein
MGNPVEPDVLPEDPETRALYRQHWQSIRTEEATGNPIQELCNFTLHEMTASTFPEMVRYLYRQQNTAFKINLSFGFILRNIETGVLRYYHSSENNARFFDVPHLIRTEEDLERFLEELSRHDILEYIRQQRPDTKWVVHLLTNKTFYLSKLIQHPIGARVVLPDHILKNRVVVALVGGANGAYTDKLCFFRCLSVHRRAPDIQAVEDRYYPYRATYDIDVMLQPTDKRLSEKLEWTSHLVLLSVSVRSNVPGYKVPVCHISEGDTGLVLFLGQKNH